ncbi:MAG TPA: L-2-hydroxyglutarate oxidase [Chlamydiales bacterium]|nr:L-2-hydroxyglutarate oxidase [Chlamydiales bacterium]
MSYSSDAIIIGAGIVGLATAFQLLQSKPHWKILVLEKETGPAFHQTGRNSGVVHTGIYYKPGSSKAKNCTQGRKELLSFCDKNNIPYKKIHKLIVAKTEAESHRLLELFNRGQANGVPGIQLLSQAKSLEIEPHVSALQSLFIPECHIIDYKQVANALCSAIRSHGGEIIFGELVEEISHQEDAITIIGKTKSYRSRLLINCAGLHCDRLARRGLKEKIEHQILPFRGEYYELTSEKKNLVNGLIYPVPDPQLPFLGVHLTHMINGKVEAGPNAVLAFAREGYKKSDFNLTDIGEFFLYSGFWKMASNYWKSGLYEIARSLSKKLFLRDLRALVPSIEEKDLLPGAVGIRAQMVTKEGKLFDDFAIRQERNSIHVLNAPSPAATASFSIGRTIAEMAINKGIS